MIAGRDRVHESDLIDMFVGNLTAVRIPAYIDPETSGYLANRLITSEAIGRFPTAADIERLGQAYGEGPITEESSARYDELALEWLRETRARCSPLQPPIDRLRLELDEVWPAGARIGSRAGKKMFAGLTRRYHQGSCLEPHQDVLKWELRPGEQLTDMTTKLTANVYLAVPFIGGELILWNKTFLTQEEYEKHQMPDSYGLRREALGDPIVRLAPQLGELIIFDAGRVHAVDRIINGFRVTASCFIGYHGNERPLFMWS